jgi:hypothetical protein
LVVRLSHRLALSTDFDDPQPDFLDRTYNDCLIATVSVGRDVTTVIASRAHRGDYPAALA